VTAPLRPLSALTLSHAGRPERIALFATLMRQGVAFPPILIKENRIADGSHRYGASLLLDFTHVPVTIYDRFSRARRAVEALRRRRAGTRST
jgi:ParB-like chromosome segregation protein Spo0J